jgi:hypothetical protein
MPAIKSLIRGNDPDNFITMLITNKNNFDLYTSNYAMKIILEDGQIINFTKHEQSRATFAAFSKLKSNLQDKPKPNLQPGDVSYFLHDFKEPVYVETVCNIDLKSAYANILLLDEMITKDTHKYLSKLVKKDRLSAVGMLASKKQVIEFKRGKPVEEREERSEFAPFFFYAVKRTFEIMSELKKICGNSYLFTWVDGIYFLPDPGIKEACYKYLKEIKFPYSMEMLSEFDVQFHNRSIKVSFYRSKTERKKRFDLPMADSRFTQIMSNALLLLNNKRRKNEKSKNCNSRRPR